MSFLKNSTSLADGVGMVMTKIDKEGIYSCLATNVAGSDSKEFMVTFVGGSLFLRFLLVVLQMYRSLLLPFITPNTTKCIVVSCNSFVMRCGVKWRGVL